MINKIDYNLIIEDININYEENYLGLGRTYTSYFSTYTATVFDTNNYIEAEIDGITSYKIIDLGDRKLYILFFYNDLWLGVFDRKYVILLENKINYDYVLQSLYPNKYFSDDCDYWVNNYWSALIRDTNGHTLEINDIKSIRTIVVDNRKVWILCLATGNWIGVLAREG